MLGAKQIAHGNLLDVGEVFLELVAQGESYNRQTSIVICTRMAIVVIGDFTFLEFGYALGSRSCQSDIACTQAFHNRTCEYLKHNGTSR